jgi:hypothetical protein
LLDHANCGCFCTGNQFVSQVCGADQWLIEEWITSSSVVWLHNVAYH